MTSLDFSSTVELKTKLLRSLVAFADAVSHCLLLLFFGPVTKGM